MQIRRTVWIRVGVYFLVLSSYIFSLAIERQRPIRSVSHLEQLESIME